MYRHINKHCRYFKRQSNRLITGKISASGFEAREEALSPKKTAGRNQLKEKNINELGTPLVNPYGKNLPCCIRDLLNDEIICCPTPQLVNDLIFTEVKCSTVGFSCCSTTKMRPSKDAGITLKCNTKMADQLENSEKSIFQRFITVNDQVKPVETSKSTYLLHDPNEKNILPELFNDSMLLIDDQKNYSLDNSFSSDKTCVCTVYEENCQLDCCKIYKGRCTMAC